MFEAEALRPLLIERNGDICALAEEIGADSEELRNFVMTTPLLVRALDEVIARGVDKSVQVLFRGLGDEHYTNQLAAAKEFLKSRPAQRRGFRHTGAIELKLPRQTGALTLTWLPPEDNRSPAPPMIEATTEEEE